MKSTPSTDYLQLPRMPTSRLHHIPGDSGQLPILGDTLPFLKDYLGLVQRKSAKYGLVFRSNALLQNTVALLGPEHNELVLKNSDKIFSNKLAWDPLLDRLFPDGFLRLISLLARSFAPAAHAPPFHGLFEYFLHDVPF